MKNTLNDDLVGDAYIQEIANIAVKKIRAVEPTRWDSTVTDNDIISQLDLLTVVKRIIQHSHEMLEIFKLMYNDVCYQITPVTMNLSFFRSQPYFQALEEIMLGLENWSKPTGTMIKNDVNEKAESKNKKVTSKGGFGNK